MRLSTAGSKELQEEVNQQLSIILPARKDLQPVANLKDVKALNGLELSITVVAEEREKVTFYGQETQKPTTIATVTIQAVSGWTGKVPPSIALQGSVLTSITDAKRLSVGDAFSSHAREVHAFLDKLVQDRLGRIEAVLARRNEEKKKEKPAPDPAPPAPQPKKQG